MQAAQQKLIQTQQQQIQELNDNLKNLHATLEKGKLPSQTIPNPGHSSSAGPQVRGCQAVTTLRSGKEIPKPHQSPPSGDVEEEYEQEELEDKQQEEEESIKAAPYPERLRMPGKDKYQTEIQEIFNKCSLNIPLLEAIKQVPKYAKYLKDLCTVKRTLRVKKKCFLAQNITALVQNKPVKCKDHGAPTIPCKIGNKNFGEALLDLGSSVNLLPYHIYQTLGIGELEPTAYTLQLVDRSVVIPRGTVEDVLVQVHNFVYPVDFIVLDTQPSTAKNDVPIILGRPFLSTCKALINCRDGHLNISFGDMSVYLNIFKTYKVAKEVDDVDDVYDVDPIEQLEEDHYESLRAQTYDKLFGNPLLNVAYTSMSVQDSAELAARSQMKQATKKENITCSTVCYMKNLEESEKEVGTPKKGKKKKKRQPKKVQHNLSPGQKVMVFDSKKKLKRMGPFVVKYIYPSGAVHVGTEGENERFKFHYKRVEHVGELEPTKEKDIKQSKDPPHGGN